jgi:dimeric dUTPase (all-alpha-NTP-PPase superfamily)
MNIDDVEAGENTIRSLADIFEHQEKLFWKYKEIEGMEFTGKCVNVHTAAGQKWLKDFLWRVTEELGESFEAAVEHEDTNHQVEELADALHFFVEFCIIAGVTPDELPTIEECVKTTSKILGMGHLSFDEADFYWSTIYHLGLVGNTLKNKPWKKTQMKTDLAEFKRHLVNAYSALISCFVIVHWNSDVEDPEIITQEIYNFYFKKNAVNQFRQKSNY